MNQLQNGVFYMCIACVSVIAYYYIADKREKKLYRYASVCCKIMFYLLISIFAIFSIREETTILELCSLAFLAMVSSIEFIDNLLSFIKKLK